MITHTHWPELKAREKIREVYGGCAMSLEEVGKALGITDEGVRKIQNKAFKKARVILENYGIGVDDV